MKKDIFQSQIQTDLNSSFFVLYKKTYNNNAPRVYRV